MPSSVRWICLSLALGMSLSARTALSQEPSPAKPSAVVSSDSLTVTISRTDLLLLLDDIAYLEADLHECKSRLQFATETPPECKSGVPWLLVAVSVLAGGVVVGLVD